MSALDAPGFAEAAVRDRARQGEACAFPPLEEYGRRLFGAGGPEVSGGPDVLDSIRLVPPVFMPRRLEKLIDLAREPVPADVDLRVRFGGFTSSLPVYVSAFGSTRAAGDGLGVAVARQAGLLGIPLVIGENIVPVSGYRRDDEKAERFALRDRIHAYAEHVPPGVGGVVVQQSTEDADAEVWNQIYSDPDLVPLIESGRIGFELKVGQGAKPGLGGMTVVDAPTADRLRDRYVFEQDYDPTGKHFLRYGSAGTFTEEILRNQVRLMRNNFPRCRVWVKLPPGRDVGSATDVARQAEADAVCLDGAEGGTGWAPNAFLDHVGLPLGECLLRAGRPAGAGTSLLASGRIWEGARAVKALALGADAIGLGRAALLAVDEADRDGLLNLVRCLALELRILISALGKYAVAEVDRDDLWPVPGPEGAPDTASARTPSGAC